MDFLNDDNNDVDYDDDDNDDDDDDVEMMMMMMIVAFTQLRWRWRKVMAGFRKMATIPIISTITNLYLRTVSIFCCLPIVHSHRTTAYKILYILGLGPEDLNT